MIKVSGLVKLTAPLLAANLVGCGGTNFTSASGTKGAGNSADGSAGGSDANSSGNANGAADAGTNGAASNNSDAGGSGKPGNGADAGNNGCASGVDPLNYNIVFLFDDTGSQVQTDPTLVRRSGALAFLTTFTNYVKAFPKAQVNMNVMSFNTVAIPEGGWTLLNSVTSAAIQMDITVATSNPNGNTAYSPAFNAANAAFAQINAQTASLHSRNYAIFLTDGVPDVDDPATIATSVNNLVTQQDVAVIAIATGPDVTTAGEATVQGLGLPLKATTYGNHIGHYYRAATPDALTNVWSSLTSAVGACTAATGVTTGTAAATGTTVATGSASGTTSTAGASTAATANSSGTATNKLNSVLSNLFH